VWTAQQRFSEFASRWDVAVDRVEERRYSIIGYGRWRDREVVLKAAKPEFDEADAGAIAAAFQGKGMVRVYDHAPGVALLEKLIPGTPLSERVASGGDPAATQTLADVVGALHASSPSAEGVVTVEKWGEGFDRYFSNGDRQIPLDLVEDAHERYTKLCRTQGTVRLLHGDLQHYNVLEDRARGWIAIDPKGVAGELEYEFGAALRNPHEVPELYSSSASVERRVRDFARRLRVDPARVLEWAYAQALLSAIWTIEDDGVVTPEHPALVLATTIGPMLS
jgi:streptomycin 6-kinase